MVLQLYYIYLEGPIAWLGLLIALLAACGVVVMPTYNLRGLAPDLGVGAEGGPQPRAQLPGGPDMDWTLRLKLKQARLSLFFDVFGLVRAGCGLSTKVIIGNLSAFA